MKKKSPKKKISRQSAKSPKIIIVLIGIILFISIVYYFIPAKEWDVSKDGLLKYPESRGKVEVKVSKTDTESNYTLETISFKSKDYVVEGLLRIPFSEKKVPGVVILPGATVPKEGTQGLAEILSSMGYASLGIEQRNRGAVDFKHDYELFSEDKEPVQHRMVFDALRAVDVLKQDARIDEKRIAILGESNGGRFAIIAAALDPDIKGVIGISTSGYDTASEIPNISDEKLIRFYRSVDPDTYLEFIPPRKLIMMHAVNDSIIPLSLAEKTFKKAGEPKQFYKIEDGGHGFSEGMKVYLEKELRFIFQ